MISNEKSFTETKGHEKAVAKIGEFDKFGSVLGLERVSELLRRLGNPQKDLKIIHIAGTNGKGSVSRFIYSALRRGGYKVGIYSSPFLEVFNERIEADGRYITDEELNRYADRASQIAKEMCDEGLLSPTEFDVVTAIAFMYFKDKETDYVVLEVGLGGRGDSTNVIEHPLMTAITSISYDHMDRLGNTLAEIAFEKAGIIKDAPVALGIMDDEAGNVIKKKAAEKQVQCIESSVNDYKIIEENLKGSTFSCKILNKNLENVKIAMIGEHQIQNAVVALLCLETMRQKKQVKLTDDQIKEGLAEAANPGRFEVVRDNQYVILDGAHNQAGTEGLVKTLKENLGDKKLLVITGMLKDKAVDEMTDIYSSLNADFIATEPDNPRKLAKEKLAELLESKGAEVLGAYKPSEALEKALGMAVSGRQMYSGIIFAGSLYLIGEIRRLLHDR